jgi:hypothetical protein
MAPRRLVDQLPSGCPERHAGNGLVPLGIEGLSDE